MSDSVNDSMNDSMNDSLPEQGAGSREVSREQGSYRRNARERALAPSTETTETTIRLNSIHPLDALAVAVASLRPDWRASDVLAALGRTHGSRHEVARRALTVALDPETRTPWRIENADLRRYDTTPTPPSIAEHRGAHRCDHGAVASLCALCRYDVQETA